MPIDTSSKEACVGAEIKHLRDKGYKQKQAIAAAYSICKGVKPGKSKKELEVELLKAVIEKAKVEQEKLSYSARKKLDESSFVFPKTRKYPIQDKAHARNALARVSQFGTEAEKKAVRAAVCKKYKDLCGENK